MISEKLRAEIVRKAKEFDKIFDESELESAWRNHSEFLKKYPFREHPELIDELTPERVYKKGAEDYFFLWVEHRTKELGAISTYGGLVYPNAVANLDKFKQLLKIAVDDSKSLAEKIDAPWDEIKGFGGDRQIAKKIIFLYYPNEVVPIFKTENLVYFAKKLGITDEEVDRTAREKYGKERKDLTVGEMYELFNELLLRVKSEVDELKDWNNVRFMRFLYETYPPPPPEKEVSVEKKPIPLLSERILFSPVDELGVACIFSMFHRELGFPYIIKVSDRFPDVRAIDKNGEPVAIELEYKASDFIAHGHPAEDCDYIVCWKNDIGGEGLERLPKIISLKEKLVEARR